MLHKFKLKSNWLFRPVTSVRIPYSVLASAIEGCKEDIDCNNVSEDELVISFRWRYKDWYSSYLVEGE